MKLIVNKTGNNIQDEGCKVLNEIFLENKKIEKIDLGCKYTKIKKGNQITSKGLFFLKDSFQKNQYLKEIIFTGK
jgi:hypothetical protein